MPLPAASANRTPLHTRVVECRGFARDDGLFDIEGSITDVKTYDIDRNNYTGPDAQR